MKALALLGASLIVLAGGSLTSAASVHQSRQVRIAAVFWLPSGAPVLGRIVASTTTGADSTATATPGATGTAAPSATPTLSPTPAPTPTTGPSYLDPVSILQNMYQVSGLLKSIHFDQTYRISGQIAVSIRAVGDAVCQGLKAHVKGNATVPGTLQSQKTEFDVIQYKTSYFRKAKSKNSRWQKVKVKQVTPFGIIPVDNPLGCSVTASSGGGSGPQAKNLLNLGPDTIRGTSVWHIHATLVDTTTDPPLEIPVDWYVSHQHSLLYRYTASVSDAARNQKETFVLNLSKFGEHIKIKAPKVGSAKP
ncbi:MAG: hypothetical protein NVSMB52_16780 [Chloroflexota bacterium]